MVVPSRGMPQGTVGRRWAVCESVVAASPSGLSTPSCGRAIHPRASAGERGCAWAYMGCAGQAFGVFSAYALNKVTHMQEIRFSVALCIYIHTHIYIYIGLPGLLGGALPSEWKGHVRSAVVFVSEDMAPRKVRRRVTGKAEKLQPYAVFGGGTFPHADSLPGPGLLRTARPGRLRAVTFKHPSR